MDERVSSGFESAKGRRRWNSMATARSRPGWEDRRIVVGPVLLVVAAAAAVLALGPGVPAIICRTAPGALSGPVLPTAPPPAPPAAAERPPTVVTDGFDGEPVVLGIPETPDGGDGRCTCGRVEALAAEEEHSIQGEARHADGRALAGATIVAEPLVGAASAATAVTDADGGFRVKGLIEGSFRLLLGGDGNAAGTPALAGGERVAVGSREVWVTLGATGVIRGRVVDDRGAPLRDAFVRAIARSGAPTLRTRTRSDGTFEIGRVAADVVYDLVAWTVDHAPAVAPDVLAVTSRPRIVLHAGQLATGRLLDADGRPIRDAQVSFGTDAVAVRASAHTDAQGRFAVRGLLDTTYSASYGTIKDDQFTFVPCGVIAAGTRDGVLRAPR